MDTGSDSHANEHSAEGQYANEQYAQGEYINWLEEVRQISKLIDKISEALVLLASKRVTLEEKIISRYFHAMASVYAQLVAKVNNVLAQGQQLRPNSCLPELQAFNREVNATLDDLLKIVRYNLNFLEQYFEFDYANRLQEKHRFVVRLEQIEQKLSSSLSF